MSKRMLANLAVLISLFVTGAFGQGLSGEEATFVKNHVSDVVKVEPARLNDSAVLKVFAAPIYKLTVSIDDGSGGSSTQEAIVARVGEKLVPISRPSTDGDYPNIQKMFRSDFKLASEADAKEVQQALDAVYPIIGSEDQKAESFHRSAGGWTFVRGKFFDDTMGFVLSTGPGGNVTAVQYVLKLPKS